ncbi:hypothetical protein ACGFI4_08435 [Micromonospora carbonacea]|uniref:hypothetical protein n=1 Tax=Micromonospora carbonacea TaxID=47853 RepID=UPI003713D995
MTDPLGPVTITARDIYDALVRLDSTVNRLADQATGHGEDLRDHETRLRVVEEARPAPRIADLEGRVRAVEARQWPLPAASLLVALAALAIGLLPKLTT